MMRGSCCQVSSFLKCLKQPQVARPVPLRFLGAIGLVIWLLLFPVEDLWCSATPLRSGTPPSLCIEQVHLSHNRAETGSKVPLTVVLRNIGGAVSLSDAGTKLTGYFELIDTKQRTGKNVLDHQSFEVILTTSHIDELNRDDSVVLDVEYDVPNQISNAEAAWTGTMHVEITGPVTLVDLAASECLQWEETFNIQPSPREALFQSHSLPPIDAKMPMVIVDGKSYTIHRITDSYYDWLVSERLVSPATAQLEDSILIVDPDTGCPITDLQTLERALLVRNGGLWLKNRDRSVLEAQVLGIQLTQLKHGTTDLLERIAKPLARFTVSLAVTQNPLQAGLEAFAGTIVKDYIWGGVASPEELFRVITSQCLEHMGTAFEKGLAVQQSLASGTVVPDHMTLETALALEAWQDSRLEVVDVDYLAWEGQVFGTTDTIAWAFIDKAAQTPVSYGEKLVSSIENLELHRRFDALVSDAVAEFESRGIAVPHALEELVEDVLKLEAFLALVEMEDITIRTQEWYTGHSQADVRNAIEDAVESMIDSLENALWRLKNTVEFRTHEVAKNIALAETGRGESER